MGSFSYICAGCGAPINGEEKCVLIHVRHGKEMGKARGTYYDYGRIEEDEDKGEGFRISKGINSHEEICNSEFDMDDSGKTSGISAWHQACYIEGDLSISDSDPNQGWGKPNPKFMKEVKEPMYSNYTLKITQTSTMITDVIAKSEKEAKEIAINQLLDEIIEMPECDFSTTKLKIVGQEDTDNKMEAIIRKYVKDFENYSPKQIKTELKKMFPEHDITHIWDEIKLRVNN